MYQLEDSELAVEPLPSIHERRLILLYEASEGGAGVLRQLLEFAQRKGLVPRLLAWARAESPDRYAEGEPYEG
ncbi:MAG: DUF1998 domain-containing protein [Anaerolineae bacterium]|nr:DUF1998 domain-containing protein [Anaerolineae bacterium]